MRLISGYHHHWSQVYWLDQCCITKKHINYYIWKVIPFKRYHKIHTGVYTGSKYRVTLQESTRDIPGFLHTFIWCLYFNVSSIDGYKHNNKVLDKKQGKQVLNTLKSGNRHTHGNIITTDGKTTCWQAS